jgi:hypothetical protein
MKYIAWLFLPMVMIGIILSAMSLMVAVETIKFVWELLNKLFNIIKEVLCGFLNCWHF